MPAHRSSAGPIVHLIGSLHVGGAEMTLYRLLSRTTRQCPLPVVITLLADEGPLQARVAALGIQVYSLGMRRGLPGPIALWRLAALMRRLRPVLLQGWMYHGNIAALVASYLSPRRPTVLWNIRHSLHDHGHKSLTQALIQFGARVSPQAAGIIYNAQASADQHEAIGYAPSRTTVIPNGFDTDTFRPDKAARSVLRDELGLPPDTRLVGSIGRYHPLKGHANFLEAAGRLAQQLPDVHYVLAGRGVDPGNAEMSAQIIALGLRNRVHLLGEQTDTARLFAAFDVATNPSKSEAFPNVVGEAMACGVPCVVTDVGDSAWLIGDTGYVVPAENATALAEAWRKLLELPIDTRLAWGSAARERIIQRFSLDRVVADYTTYYDRFSPHREDTPLCAG